MWGSCGLGRRDCWEHTKRLRKPRCVFWVVSGFKHHKFNENAQGKDIQINVAPERTSKFGGRRELNSRYVGRSGEGRSRSWRTRRCRRGRSKGKRMARRVGGKGREELRAKAISNHFCKLIKQRKGYLRKLSESYDKCKFQV